MLGTCYDVKWICNICYAFLMIHDVFLICCGFVIFYLHLYRIGPDL